MYVTHPPEIYQKVECWWNIVPIQCSLVWLAIESVAIRDSRPGVVMAIYRLHRSRPCLLLRKEVKHLYDKVPNGVKHQKSKEWR